MGIYFLDDPPYDLGLAQTAHADAIGDVIELSVTISAPEIRVQPVTVRVMLTHPVASDLVKRLRAAAVRAGLGQIFNAS